MSKIIDKVKVSKSRPNSQIKVTVSKNAGIYTQKAVVTRNMNMQYKKTSTGCSKVISKLKYLKNKGKLQGQVYRVRYVGTHGKFLSLGMLM